MMRTPALLCRSARTCRPVLNFTGLRDSSVVPALSSSLINRLHAS
jgi:hypothetical protein